MIARGIVVALVLFAASVAPAVAQPGRYELGRRLRDLEADWAGAPAKRAEALPDIEKAVQSFFSFQLGRAAKSLDAARFALAPAGPPSPARLLAAGLAWKPERRVVAKGTPSLVVSVAPLYSEVPPLPAGLGYRILVEGGASAPLVLAEGLLEQLPASRDVRVAELGEGDHRLRFEVREGDGVLATATQLLSVIDRLPERRAALGEALKSPPPLSSVLPVETARGLVGLVDDLLAGKEPETDVPAARYLGDAEAILAAARNGEVWHAGRPGDFPLRLGAAPADAARLFVPDGAGKDRRLPLVVALHGAGGSENMWFESYGRGAVVALARERGFAVLATRSGFATPRVWPWVEEIAKLWPVDPERVYLIGHSMGAGQAINVALKDPARVAALAVLGGGQAVRRAETLKPVPIFVAAGERDFGRRGAEAFHRALVDGGVGSATIRIYPKTEHLFVVPEALPDVYAFLARVRAERSAPAPPK